MGYIQGSRTLIRPNGSASGMTISKCHNDIFRPRASALFLAMLQISGAVVGLAHDFASNFEQPPAN